MTTNHLLSFELVGTDVQWKYRGISIVQAWEQLNGNWMLTTLTGIKIAIMGN